MIIEKFLVIQILFEEINRLIWLESVGYKKSSQSYFSSIFIHRVSFYIRKCAFQLTLEFKNDCTLPFWQSATAV